MIPETFNRNESFVSIDTMLVISVSVKDANKKIKELAESGWQLDDHDVVNGMHHLTFMRVKNGNQHC